MVRTERSVINRCQPNRQGITRLDSYYDPNERKYYLTPPSVEAVIQEEFQRANKSSEPSASEPFESPVATVKHPRNSTSADDRKFQMEREIVDLQIANLGKDYLIDQLQGKRNGPFSKVVLDKSNRGQLEIKLIQLNTPKS